MNRATIKKFQLLLGVTADGVWGDKTQAAADRLRLEGWRIGMASSFADPDDVAAFRECKAKGKSDQECFKVGDNGIGCWKDDTSAGSGPSVAIPPDDMIRQFGSTKEAQYRAVSIRMVGDNHKPFFTAVASIKDRMPWKNHIHNGAVIDCNPDTCALLGQTPPMMEPCIWSFK